MDEMAGEHVKQMIARNTNTNIPFFLPSQRIGIQIASHPVVANVDDKLRGEFYLNDIKRHYNNTVGLSHQTFNQVNWESIRLSTRNHSDKNQMLKCLHNQWPTYERNHRWKIADTNMCPLCNTKPETWQHVLQCSSVHATRQRAQSISNIRKELGIVKTYPDLTDHIIHIITTFSSDQQPTVHPIDFKPYRLDLR